MHIYIYTHIYIVAIYIYICTYYIYMYVYIYIYLIYIYVYIYILCIDIYCIIIYLIHVIMYVSLSLYVYIYIHLYIYIYLLCIYIYILYVRTWIQLVLMNSPIDTRSSLPFPIRRGRVWQRQWFASSTSPEPVEFRFFVGSEESHFLGFTLGFKILDQFFWVNPPLNSLEASKH